MTTFSTQPYKGTRDFYPMDSLISAPKDTQNILYHQYIFDTWRKVFLACGFSEYDCSLIENADSFVAKSGEELGGEQLYNFRDKSDRHIALRPEMTVSVARMIADKYENLRYPLRWFSIPNCFRYEAPQKGRLREHWQVNADIFGLESGLVEVEMLLVVAKLFKAFGASNGSLRLWFNSRKVLDQWLEINNWLVNKIPLYKVLDNWHKNSSEANLNILKNIVDEKSANKIYETCEREGKAWDEYLDLAKKSTDLKKLIEILPGMNLGFDFSLNCTMIRGQAYYTGLVFEAFDTNTSNPRSLVGGGRYDDLMSLYGKNKLPSIGFGSGDATWLEFLQNWNLLNGFDGFETWKKQKYPEKVGIIPYFESDLIQVFETIIPELEGQNKTWDIDYGFDRSENKRFETLKKRGCSEVIKVNSKAQ